MIGIISKSVAHDERDPQALDTFVIAAIVEATRSRLTGWTWKFLQAIAMVDPTTT
jgi:hypothetical protein